LRPQISVKTVRHIKSEGAGADWRTSSLVPLRRIARRFFLKYRAKPLLIEAQLKSVLIREMRDLPLSIFLVYWPQPLQFVLVNDAVPSLGSFSFQLAPNSFRESLHVSAKVRDCDDRQPLPRLSMP
jgi:hypothetical protein